MNQEEKKIPTGVLFQCTLIALLALVVIFTLRQKVAPLSLSLLASVGLVGFMRVRWPERKLASPLVVLAMATIAFGCTVLTLNILNQRIGDAFVALAEERTAGWKYTWSMFKWAVCALSLGLLYINKKRIRKRISQKPSSLLPLFIFGLAFLVAWVAFPGPDISKNTITDPLEDLHGIAKRHGRRVFGQAYNDFLKECGAREATNRPELSDIDISPVLYWAMLYGDAGIPGISPNYVWSDIPKKINEKKFYTIDELSAEYGVNQLRSSMPFIQGGLEASSYRDLGESELVLLKNSENFDSVKINKRLADEHSEVNFALDAYAASQYLDHFLSLYLIHMDRLIGDDPKAEPKEPKTEPKEPKTELKEPKTEPKEPKTELKEPKRKLVISYIPSTRLAETGRAEDGDDPTATSLTDRQLIDRAFAHIRGTGQPGTLYRLPIPIPMTGPYTARQWINGPIQTWTLFLFFLGMATLSRQLLEVGLASRGGLLQKSLQDQFKRHAKIFKTGGQKLVGERLDGLVESMEQAIWGTSSRWKRRSLFFSYVNFAIPLFGLLGTVAGISGAFEKAPEFIRAGSSPLRQEGAMGLLATSISVAFFTTLVACFLAVVFFFFNKGVLEWWEAHQMRAIKNKLGDSIQAIREIALTGDLAVNGPGIKVEDFERFTGTKIADWKSSS